MYIKKYVDEKGESQHIAVFQPSPVISVEHFQNMPTKSRSKRSTTKTITI